MWPGILQNHIKRLLENKMVVWLFVVIHLVIFYIISMSHERHCVPNQDNSTVCSTARLAHNKENIEALRYWPFVEGCTGD